MPITKEELLAKIQDKLSISVPGGNKLDVRIHMMPGTHAILDVLLESVIEPLEARVAKLEAKVAP